MIPPPLIQVFNETGSTPLGVLGGVASLTLSDVFCDLGSLSLMVPRNVTGAALLDVDADRQLKVSWPGTSAPPMWFLNDDDASTWVSDAPESEPVQLTCRSLAQVLDEALVLPPGGVGSTPTTYGFAAGTPGVIVAALFAAAQARGALQGLTLAGGATVDATGLAWPLNAPAVNYKTGTSLQAVLKGMYASGLLEWRMNGRTLEIHAPSGGLDRTLPTVLRPRRDVLAAPLTRSRRSVATTVVVEGANSATVARTQSLAGRRAREVYVSQTSAPGAALTAVGDLYLAAHSVADLQMTHDLTDGESTPRPWVDYRPGDRVQTIAAGRGVTSRRVAQVALSMSPTEVKATLELGSLLKTSEEQMTAALTRLLPGDSAIT